MEYLNLEQYKASGIYTIEIDASQTFAIPLTTGRLLIGSSRRGPINTVVLVNDTKVSRNVYGARDYFLENRGSYFHKYLNVMLAEGPVYAMNVVPIDLLEDNYDGAGYQNKDRAAFLPFNAEVASYNDVELMYPFKTSTPAYAPHTAPLKNYYNRQKFWYASDVELTRVKNNAFSTQSVAQNNLISIVNMGKRPVTVFMFRANVAGYDLTAKEWYSNSAGDNVKPTFVHDDDFISDYMVDVLVVEGDWTNYARLAIDPTYSAYFNERGLKIDKVNDFTQVSEVVVVTRQIGSIIPDFLDKSQRNIAIDRIFNGQYPLTELIMAIDYTRLEQYDLTTEYFQPVVDTTVGNTYRIDLIGHGASELEMLWNGTSYVTNTANICDNSDVLHAADAVTYPVLNPMIDLMSYRKPVHYQYSFVYTTPVTPTKNDIVLTTPAPLTYKIKAYENSKLYKLWRSGHLVSGDYNPVFGGSPAAKVYIKILGAYDELNVGKYILIEGYSDKQLTVADTLSIDLTNHAVTFQTCQSTSVNAPTVDPFKWVFSEALYPGLLTIQKIESNKLWLTVDSSISTEVFKYIRPGYYLRAKVNEGRPRMLRILSVSKKIATSSPQYTYYEVLTMLPTDSSVDGIDVGDDASKSLTAYMGINNYMHEVVGYKIPEFVLDNARLMPTGGTGITEQQKIYKFIFDSGLDKAITSGEALDVRHIVDSYDGEISDSSKYYLVKLGAQHAKTLVFLNAPSMKQFETSVDPSFIDAYSGLLNMQYVVDGGSYQLTPPSFAYKLASGIEKGVPIESFAIYGMPNLMIREGNKNRSIPPAAYISNAYIRKFKSGNSYGIVAGKRGVITEAEVIGVEYDLTDEDRMILEPAGYNLIIRRRGIGTMLFTNNTAYQKVQSALNNAHVRDTLITIEKDIERILYNFLFDFNDGITQIRVKTLVENYLDSVMSSRGISWYSVKMDAMNNPNEVIEANAGVIDVYVDFPRGIHKFINRITITRKGGTLSASQSGFGITM